MFFDPAPGSTPSVLRAAFRSVELQPPYRKAIAMVVNDMEVGRVLQRDPIDRKVVREIGDDQAWHLLAATTSSLFRKIPPGDLLVEKFLATPAIDNTIAHHARARNML